MLQKKNKNQNRCQGFTLVELIIVIVIILILAAVAVPSITRYVQKSKVAKCANQRHELATQFQIMGTDVPEIALCKDTIEVKSVLNSGIIDYMVKGGYCSEDITVCPVYNTQYEVEITSKDGQQLVTFSCPCIDSVKGYLGQCESYYKYLLEHKEEWGSGSFDRKDLLKKVADERGFMKVSDSMKSGTSFGDETLYWKPYFLADGTMVLYGTVEGNNAWSNWDAYLIYYDGQVYQSTNKNGNKPDKTNIAGMSSTNSNSMDEYLKSKNFEKVPK